MMRAQSSTARYAQLRRSTLATAVLFLVAMLVAPHARAWPLTIPVGSSTADELMLNFDTSALEVPAQGRLSFFLMTSNLNADDSLDVELFGGPDGKDSMGIIYSGPLVSYEGTCAIGDALCGILLDGSFSIGLRATGGNVQLVGAFVYATGTDNVPTSPVVASVGTALPPAPSVPPAPAALPATTTTPPATKPPTAPPVTAATVDLIEYHHAAWDEYFVTGIPEEIAALDNGTLAGWVRTGRGFKAYPLGSSEGVSVCRFFSVAIGPRSSHFYTPFPTECSGVKANPDWLFEGDVFRIDVPDSNGTCPPNTVPVYRLYNNGQGGAPNHRYTVDLGVRAQMIGETWIPEGYGPIGVIMCAPQ
jgi:hypothetical protein